MKRLTTVSKSGFWAAASLPLFFLGGCLEDKVAGGSSEVDNPIVVAFVDSLGVSITTSGSLSIYLAGQNPAIDPYPLLKKQLSNVSSLQLSARDFVEESGDSSLSYNLLLLADNDSVGALIQNLTYDPVLKRFVADTGAVSGIRLPVMPLESYEASLSVPEDSGLLRVFIPGSPYQSVVVESTFVIDGVPRGRFSFRVLGGDGSERPLKLVTGGGEQGNHHQVDSSAAPIVRPITPAPTQSLQVFAGNDISLSSTVASNGYTSHTLAGTVMGISPTDPRLAVRWTQLNPGPQGSRAIVERGSSLNTKVYFPKPGAYTFILSAVVGTNPNTWIRVEDTVLIGIQAPIEQPVFLSPAAGDSVYLSYPVAYPVVWESQRNDSLWLDFSRNGGATWTQVMIVKSHQGFNTAYWTPEGDTSSSARLRLRRVSDNAILATSATFKLRVWNFFMPKSQGSGYLGDGYSTGSAASYGDTYEAYGPYSGSYSSGRHDSRYGRWESRTKPARKPASSSRN